MSNKLVLPGIAAGIGVLVAAVATVIVKRSRFEAPPISPTVPRVDEAPDGQEPSSDRTSSVAS